MSYPPYLDLTPYYQQLETLWTTVSQQSVVVSPIVAIGAALGGLNVGAQLLGGNNPDNDLVHQLASFAFPSDPAQQGVARQTMYLGIAASGLMLTREILATTNPTTPAPSAA